MVSSGSWSLPLWRSRRKVTTRFALRGSRNPAYGSESISRCSASTGRTIVRNVRPSAFAIAASALRSSVRSDAARASKTRCRSREPSYIRKTSPFEAALERGHSDEESPRESLGHRAAAHARARAGPVQDSQRRGTLGLDVPRDRPHGPSASASITVTRRSSRAILTEEMPGILGHVPARARAAPDRAGRAARYPVDAGRRSHRVTPLASRWRTWSRG